MSMQRFFVHLLILFISVNSYAWNALGHRLVAQIAYDNLTSESKAFCDKYSKGYGKSSIHSNFVAGASWLDAIRKKDIHWYDALHYIDIPFSDDRSKLPPVPQINALWGINQAIAVLSSKKSSTSDKRLSLRILSHLIGDIHQPLHTVTKVSIEHPKGDMGGNLFLLTNTPRGKNLHQFWDNGGGAFVGNYKNQRISKTAAKLQNKWKCDQALNKKNPREWVNDTHKIALNQVYRLMQYKIPSEQYKQSVQQISERQIALAGCRLAYLLNNINKNNTQNYS